MQNVQMAGLEVSRMCFGTLTMGPLQKNFSIEKGADLIEYAFTRGVTFFDTAELYGTYPYLRSAISRIAKRFGRRPIISTKSYAYDTERARQAVENARQDMGVDVIDVFMMHEQESRLTLAGHREALEYYLEQKARGVIKAVGVSTHAIEVVEACAEMPEIDVIHPIVNLAGLGIIDAPNDGTGPELMLRALSRARKNGKGIFAMKPLGGGNLAKTYDECMQYVLENADVHSVAIGMQSFEEIDMNVSVFEGKKVAEDLREKCEQDDKFLYVADWCRGCKICVSSCQFGALKPYDKRVEVDRSKCVTCGYCSKSCPVFALKIY
ncbi:MAG: aldo/keto reductase [Bacillota bacterium]